MRKITTRLQGEHYYQSDGWHQNHYCMENLPQPLMCGKNSYVATIKLGNFSVSKL